MTRNERRVMVNMASAQMQLQFYEAAAKHGLTFGEIFSILGDMIRSEADGQIQEERRKLKNDDE